MALQTTSKQYLSQLRMIYSAQAMALFIFGLVAYFISQSEAPETLESENFLIYILAGILIVALSAAHFVFNILIRKIDKQLGLKTKLEKYQVAILIRSALLEVPGFVASVICILTGSLLPLMGVAVVLIIFFLLRPSVNGIVQDLNLTIQEKVMLENPENILK